MIIKVENISKKFGDKILFNNLSIEIKKGESLVIVGESGSGKSTILNILSLIETVDSGSVYWEKEKIEKIGTKKVNRIIRNKIGYLFQNYALLDNKTVYENIEIACMYKSYSSKEQKQKEISNALERVGLKGFEQRKIFSLSGGEQQRVALARIIVKPCEIIFADEPTGNLDKENSEKIMNILFELKNEGKAIVVVTHDKDMVNRFEKKLNLSE